MIGKFTLPLSAAVVALMVEEDVHITSALKLSGSRITSRITRSKQASLNLKIGGQQLQLDNGDGLMTKTMLDLEVKSTEKTEDEKKMWIRHWLSTDGFGGVKRISVINPELNDSDDEAKIGILSRAKSIEDAVKLIAKRDQAPKRKQGPLSFFSRLALVPAASPSASTTMKLGVGIPNPTSSSPTVSGESTSPSPSASSVEVDGDSTSSKEMLPLSDSKADGETTATHFDAVIREAALRQKIKSGNYERNDIDEIAVLMAGEHVLTYAKSLSRGTFDKYVIDEIETRENLEQRINDGDARAKRPLENRNHTFLVMLHLAASATSE